jgi:hypothetical protein
MPMKHIPGWFLTLALALAGIVPAAAQSTADKQQSLGDLARQLRKEKKQTVPVITNENFSQLHLLIKQSEQRALALGLALAPPLETEAKPPDPEVTCNFSYSGKSKALQAGANHSQQDLPDSELSKLDGPAVIAAGNLQVSVFNGTKWDVREITVGLTIIKHETPAAGLSFGSARLLPASDAPLPTLKKPDVTVLYHLKGSAAPFTTAAFQESLTVNLAPEAEWHWAILQARGIPPE